MNEAVEPARRHRRWTVYRGAPEETARAADALLGALDPDAVLWVGAGSARFADTPRSMVKRLLGRAFDAVVIDGHGGVDADLLGRCQGFVWGGGCLVLRLPVGAPPGDPRLAVEPYPVEAVGGRFFARVEAAFGGTTLDAPPLAVRRVHGTAEQAAVVDWLVSRASGDAPAHAVLLSDRGRGKSSALGLALARLPAGHRIAVSASDPQQCAEVLRFAAKTTARFVTIDALATGPERYDVIVVDEAAQVPVPLLQRLVRRHPTARFAFATTARGYEGTGRGFVLRFLRWLEGLEVPVERATLREPIRWAAGDPLEARVARALLLDAEPAAIDDPAAVDAAAVEHVVLDPDRLAADEALLRGFFGLLVHAHYRTTPADLARLLDAPNLHAHALLHAGRVVAACLCAEEGGLSPERVIALYRGKARIRGHALPETLVCHAGRVEAGGLSMIRSVRIATHPALRRLGLASRLVAAVEGHHAPDLFGTLFGATPALLAFRRSLGYRLVRVGVNAGSRTGEPSAVMIRPVSERAQRLCAALRGDLARDLPTQLALMRADGEVFLDDALVDALGRQSSDPSEMSAAARLEGVAAYALGPRPLEAAGRAIVEFVEAHRPALAALDPTHAALLQGRIIDRRGWSRLTRELGYPSVRATMRAMRRAMQALVERATPDLELEPVQTT